jgi:hypothetical protein
MVVKIGAIANRKELSWLLFELSVVERISAGCVYQCSQKFIGSFEVPYDPNKNSQSAGEHAYAI